MHLELDNYITLNEKAWTSPNLADQFSVEDLRKIGDWCWECYDRDKQSRTDWERRTSGAMELATQVQKEKSFPWPDCSNIIFPLVTIAALQFHARAYPTLINGRNIVSCRVIGDDPEGVERSRADRIEQHMSWQLLEQDEDWEEETDRALLNIAIVGCGFKKTYYDGDVRHNESTYVHAKDLVFDYWAKSVEKCMTKTHIIPMYRNEIYSRVQAGVFCDVLAEQWYLADAQVSSGPREDERDNRAGVTRPASNHNTPFTMLEQHCWLDLDGDGYAEPYIITFEESSKCVVRIVTRFDREVDIQRNTKGKIISIQAWEYFTKIPFIPNPDGSIMDIGFGVLLGPLNESVDAAINQLFDAGTLSNTAGGFLGRGAKIRGGIYEFKPFSWNRVDSTGDDLRKNVFPLPVREPSAVMFSLLNLIIDFTSRISGTTDINVGENPGQNTPAETSRAMVEQGQKIYSAIFKRVWRSLKQEFHKLYKLNAVNLPTQLRYGAQGATIAREDYTGPIAGVAPEADPYISSDGARYAQAAAIKQLSIGNPAYDADAVEIRVLKSLGVQDVGTIYKGIANAPPPGPDVKIQIQEMKNQVAQAKLQLDAQKIMVTLQELKRMNDGKLAMMAAQVFKLQEEGKNVEAKQKIEAFRAAMELVRQENTAYDSQLQSLQEIGKNELDSRGLTGTGTVSGMEGEPSYSGGLPPASSALPGV